MAMISFRKLLSCFLSLTLLFSHGTHVYADDTLESTSEEQPTQETIDLFQNSTVNDEIDPETAQYRMGLIVQLVLLGRKSTVESFLTEWINKMIVPELDTVTKYRIKISASPFPNAFVKGNEITINMGLIAFSKDVVQLLSVVAHEMTHANPKHLELLGAKSNIDQYVNVALKALSVANADQGKMREELRADIGSVDRIIRAGLNPNSIIELESNFEKLLYGNNTIVRKMLKPLFSDDYEFLSTHPHPRIRLELMRSYIAYKMSKDTDFTELQSPDWPRSWKDVKLRTEMYSEIFQGTIIARVMSYGFVASIGLFLKSMFDAAMASQSEDVLEIVVAGYNSTTSTITSVLIDNPDIMSYFEIGIAGIGMSVMAFLLNYSSKIFGEENSIYSLMTFKKFRSRMFNIVKIYLERNKAEGLSTIDQLNKWRETLKHLESLEHNGKPKFNGDEFGFMLVQGIAKKQIKQILTKTLEEPTNHFSYAVLRMTDILSVTADKEISDLLHSIVVKVEKDEPTKIEKHYIDRINAINDVHKINWYLMTPTQKFELLNLLIEFDQPHLVRSIIGDVIAGTRKDILAAYANRLETTNHNLIFAYRTFLNSVGTRYIKKESSFYGTIDREMKLLYDDLATEITKVRTRGSDIVGSDLWLERHNDDFAFSRSNASHFDKLRSEFEAYLISHFKTFEEFSAYVESGGYDRFGIFSNVIFQVLKKSGWINTNEDLFRALENESYWPTPISNVTKNKTDFDNFMITHLERLKQRVGIRYSNLPGIVDGVHKWAIEKHASLNKSNTLSFEQEFRWWIALTQNGVSVYSDKLFVKLWHRAHKEFSKQELVSFLTSANIYGATDRRILDSSLRGMVYKEAFFKSLEADGFKQQFEEVKDSFIERKIFIEKINRDVRDALYDAPAQRAYLLEELSERINATREESKLIASKKSSALESSTNSEDLAVRALSTLVEQIGSWPNNSRWQLAFFLRGETNRVPPQYQKWSRLLPPSYLKLFFDNLPTEGKLKIMSGILTGQGSPLGSTTVKAGVAQWTIRKILKGRPKAEVDIAVNLVDALLAGLDYAGVSSMQIEILNFILANYGDEHNSTSDVIKNVLEKFGSLGIKVGQFLAATELLGEHSAGLHTLEDSARKPTREEIWQELENALGPKLDNYEVLQLLGSASIKFVVLVRDRESGNLKVLKITRLEAVKTTPNQFKIIEGALKYLKQKDAKTFGVFESVLVAAKRALQRELNPHREVDNSNKLREHYNSHSTNEIKFLVPEEKVIADRVIESEYVAGVSMRTIPANERTEFANLMAKAESRDWTNPNLENRLFDPDRHLGNWLISTRSNTIGTIDLGQAITMSHLDYNNIVQLFAAAQIFAVTGLNDTTLDSLATTLNLDAQTKTSLGAEIKKLFPQVKGSPSANYFGILTAYSKVKSIPDSYYAYPISLVHVKTIADMASTSENFQNKAFEGHVTKAAEQLKSNLSMMDKGRAVWNMAKQSLGFPSADNNEVTATQPAVPSKCENGFELQLAK